MIEISVSSLVRQSRRSCGAVLLACAATSLPIVATDCRRSTGVDQLRGIVELNRHWSPLLEPLVDSDLVAHRVPKAESSQRPSTSRAAFARIERSNEFDLVADPLDRPVRVSFHLTGLLVAAGPGDEDPVRMAIVAGAGGTMVGDGSLTYYGRAGPFAPAPFTTLREFRAVWNGLLLGGELLIPTGIHETGWVLDSENQLHKAWLSKPTSAAVEPQVRIQLRALSDCLADGDARAAVAEVALLGTALCGTIHGDVSGGETMTVFLTANIVLVMHDDAQETLASAVGATWPRDYYERSFAELGAISSSEMDLPLATALRLLENRPLRVEDIQVAGVRIPGEWVVLGVPLVLGLQVLAMLSARALRRRRFAVSESEEAWLPLYGGSLAWLFFAGLYLCVPPLSVLQSAFVTSPPAWAVAWAGASATIACVTGHAVHAVRRPL